MVLVRALSEKNLLNTFDSSDIQQEILCVISHWKNESQSSNSIKWLNMMDEI
jgi:hypothetical protein